MNTLSLECLKEAATREEGTETQRKAYLKHLRNELDAIEEDRGVAIASRNDVQVVIDRLRSRQVKLEAQIETVESDVERDTSRFKRYS